MCNITVPLTATKSIGLQYQQVLLPVSHSHGWIPGYQTILQRLCCTATIASSSSPADGVHESENEGENNSEFDLGFVSRAQFDMGQNYDVVRYMLFSGESNRLCL